MQTLSRRSVVFVLAVTGLAVLAGGVFLDAVLRGRGPSGSELPVLTVSQAVVPPRPSETGLPSTGTGLGAAARTTLPASPAPLPGNTEGDPPTQPGGAPATPPLAGEADRSPSQPSPTAPEAPRTPDSSGAVTATAPGPETFSGLSSKSTLTTAGEATRQEEPGDSERIVIRPPVRESDDSDGGD